MCFREQQRASLRPHACNYFLALVSAISYSLPLATLQRGVYNTRLIGRLQHAMGNYAGALQVSDDHPIAEVVYR
ncbi:hypothetical protein BDN71DRAFT_1443536 [Pleurotus eryngii]|uniref:Uncharacterized protein n=1 Tax=Pleurotus eryngii TaxID=5323 RepID=A0A9P6DIR6_PLEER|nr:hypothetical protein BDN71DRAFT_1443536 [Pleurotus eryngii]